MAKEKTMATTIRVDRDVAAAARSELSASAMTLSGAMSIFLEAIARDGALPTIAKLKGGDER